MVHHEAGERNYHIFYQLIAATNDDTTLAESLGFSNRHMDFNYARRDEVNSIRHVNELEGYNEVQEAMEVSQCVEWEYASLVSSLHMMLRTGSWYDSGTEVCCIASCGRSSLAGKHR